LTILKKPIRTCICCKVKLEQIQMLRLMCKDKKLISFDGNGRSFYICNDCINIVLNMQNNQKDYKKIEKSFYKECKNKDDYIGQLKEILTHVR